MHTNMPKLTNYTNLDAVFNEFIHANVFSFGGLLEQRCRTALWVKRAALRPFKKQPAGTLEIIKEGRYT